MNYKQLNPTFSPLVELSQKDVTSFWLNLVEWRDTSVIFCHNWCVLPVTVPQRIFSYCFPTETWYLCLALLAPQPRTWIRTGTCCCLCFGKPQPFVALRINLAPFRWKPGENMRMCWKPVSENVQKPFRKWWCGCETAIQEFYDRRHGSMANFWAVSLWHIWCDVFS